MSEYEPPSDWSGEIKDSGSWGLEWQDLIEPPLRAVWHTFTDEQKKAISHSLLMAANGWQSSIEGGMGDDL